MTDRWEWLEPSCRRSIPAGGSAIVEETSAEGRAKLEFVAPIGWRLEYLAFHHRRHRFDWLRVKNSADGIVLARRPDGTWEAHIVECKATIKDKEWLEIRDQLRGSRIRLEAIRGVLGIEIDRVVLYTAYRNDRIGRPSPDPVLAESEVGQRGTVSTADLRQMSGRVDWYSDAITLQGFPPLPHRRVALNVHDDTGYATVSLSP